MNLNLAGKTVIVTGGASNIGRGIALAFASENSNVVIADIDQEQAKVVAKEANALGGKTIAIRTDATDFDSVKNTAAKVLEEFGQIDILVNNAGGGRPRLFINQSIEEMEKVINLNFWSVLNCTKAVINHMVNRRYGKIISISSGVGRTGVWAVSIYSACKGGVITLTQALAKEFGPFGINVNAICPQYTKPDDVEHDTGESSAWKAMAKNGPFPEGYLEQQAQSTPLGRLGRPQDIANAALFLASDAASYITGESLGVTGGNTFNYSLEFAAPK